MLEYGDVVAVLQAVVHLCTGIAARFGHKLRTWSVINDR